MPVRVGIIDSGLRNGSCPGFVAGRNFCDGEADEISSLADLLGHGSAVAERIAQPGVEIFLARVFGQRLSCTPRAVARAIDWLVQNHIHLINMSFGLRHDRDVLRCACERALERGVCLVAASPARGAAVFPAGYPGVVRATGDARCRAGEISRLDSPQADFGGCVGEPAGGPVGASVGCASVTAALAALALENPGWERDQLCAELAQGAHYHGPERRVAGSAGPGTGAP